MFIDGFLKKKAYVAFFIPLYDAEAVKYGKNRRPKGAAPNYLLYLY
jgi:hypothetical protein